jgi:hypothetical protein
MVSISRVPAYPGRPPFLSGFSEQDSVRRIQPGARYPLYVPGFFVAKHSATALRHGP